MNGAGGQVTQAMDRNATTRARPSLPRLAARFSRLALDTQRDPYLVDVAAREPSLPFLASHLKVLLRPVGASQQKELP